VPKGTDGEPAKFLKAKPVTDQEKCTACGICAKACPMGSIDPEEKFEATGICIKCQACIKKCPAGAKSFDDAAFLSHRQMLMENFAAERKEVTLVI
jgi:ferredoxin